MMRAFPVAAFAALVLIAIPAAATPGPAAAPEYWFDSWQIETLWAQGARGQGITIAEIDTGVNADLPELRGRILPGIDFGERGNGHVDRQLDDFGHGTAMASIMVARPGVLGITGLAPGAKVLPIAIPLDGTSTAGRPDRVPRAIRYAVDHGAQIISMSFGSNRSQGDDPLPCPDSEQAAIYYALRKGSLVLASVGNTGPDTNTIQDPGVCLGVLAVGAVDASGTVAHFSAREPYLTLVAPGVSVPSLGRIEGEAFSGDGTSQATALTAATAALVWSARPNLDARGVATRIIATLDAHRDTPSAEYGYGLLDAYEAVTADVPADTPNPVFDAVEPFMARAAAFTKPLPRPAPATTKALADASGSYERGSLPWLTAQVRLGLVLAAAALLLLLSLFVVGVPARPVYAPAPIPLPAPLPAPARAARPYSRPRPYVRPRPYPLGHPRPYLRPRPYVGVPAWPGHRRPSPGVSGGSPGSRHSPRHAARPASWTR